MTDRTEGFRLGAVDFVSKPFHRDELLARVRTHLELGRLRNHLESQVAQRTAELYESEGRFRTVANSAPVMIWTSGQDKLCTFFNKGWLDFTGRTMEKELGDGWAQGVHPDDLKHCLATYTSAFDARQEFKMSYRLRRSDREYRWVLDHGVPLLTPDGAFRGYIGSCLDVTDLKTAHDEALRQQKLESVSVLAAGIAHDFNNLLSSIIADADLAIEEMKDRSLPMEEVKTIRDIAFRASEIVRELMVYSGHESGSRFEPVALSPLIRDMLKLLKTVVSKNVTITADLADDLPLVRGHAPQLRQAVMNLVINASEAIQEGRGTITVRVYRVNGNERSTGSAAQSAPAGYVTLQVSDTGCGMTADQKARVFDPYFTTKVSGRGLGMAVVHGVVRAHDGAIHVESTPGQGTTFHILLPCSD
jgi:PAS domain S-box-containing protein